MAIDFSILYSIFFVLSLFLTEFDGLLALRLIRLLPQYRDAVRDEDYFCMSVNHQSYFVDDEIFTWSQWNFVGFQMRQKQTPFPLHVH